MKKYERPIMIFEEFSTDQAIAATACSEKNVEFTCFRGPQNDTENVLIKGTCRRGAAYQSGVNTAKSSYKTKTFEGVDGLAYLCTKTWGNGDTTSEWHVVNGVLTHAQKKVWGAGHRPGQGYSDTHGNDYHCMVAGITNFSTVSTS